MITVLVIIGCIYSYVFSGWSVTVDKGFMLCSAACLEWFMEIGAVYVVQYLRGKRGS